MSDYTALTANFLDDPERRKQVLDLLKDYGLTFDSEGGAINCKHGQLAIFTGAMRIEDEPFLRAAGCAFVAAPMLLEENQRLRERVESLSACMRHVMQDSETSDRTRKYLHSVLVRNGIKVTPDEPKEPPNA